MSSSIYNHKHLQPTGASTQPGPGGPSSSQQQQLNAHRLNDFFEPIRQEFDVLAQDIAVLRGQRDEFENKVTSQVNELNIIRQSLYDLETQHTKIRTQYEDEIRSLRSEILALRTARDGPPPPREGIASLGRGTLNERDREAVGLGPPSSMPPSIPPSSSIPPNASSLLNNVAPGGRAPGDALGIPGGSGRPNSDSLVPVAGPVGLGVGSGPGGGGGGVVVSGPGGPGMGPGGGMTGVMGPGGPGVYPPSGSANPAEGFYRGAVDRDRDRLDSMSTTRDRERERDLRDGRDLRDRDRDRDRERERDLGVGRDRDRMESRERGDRDRLLSSADSRERDRDIIMRDVRAGAGDVRDIRDIRTADDRQREMMAMALSRGGAERDIRDMRDVRDIRDIRDRELRGERDVRGERDRDVLMRDAIRDLPPSAGGPSSGRDLRGERDFPGGRERDGMRDRDLRDRERDRDRDREGRDRDRDGREGREVKRIKTEGGPNAGKGGAKNDPYSSPLLQTAQNSLALGPPSHPSQPGSIALGPPPGGRDAVMRDAREPSIRENGTSSSAPSQTPKLPPAPGPPYPSQTQGNQPPPPGREPGGGAPQTPNIHSMGTNGPHPQTPTGPGMGVPPPSTPTAASGEYPPTAYPPTSGPGGNGPPPSSSAQQAAPVAPNSGGGAPPQPSPSIQPSSASAVGASGGVGAAPGGSGGAGQQQLIYPQPGPGGIIDLSLDPHTVPSELKKEGSDWYAVFNPNLPSGGGGGKEGGKESGSVVGGKEGRRLDVSLVHTLMHESVVCCVRFSADGKFLATGCNRTAQIYDTKTGAKTCVLVDEEASKTGDLYIRSVCFSPDGKYLATGAEDKQIRIWDIAKRKIRNVFEGHQQEIYSLDFSRDGRLIVSGSGDRTARIWDMADGSTNKILTINEPDSIDAGVTSVCISPDGRLVAAGSLDTIVRIWDVQTGTLVERLKGHRDSVYSVAFTPDGRGLVSGSLDKTLKYWDVRPILRRDGSGGPQGSGIVGGAAAGSSKNGKEGGEKGSQCTMNFVGHKDYVLSVAVSHDGQWVVSGSKDRGVQFWDAKTAVVQCMLQGHKNSVISIDLSPAASLLATGSGDWQARIWSYQAL